MFVRTGVWSRYAGPEPGMLGCRAPGELLAKHGIDAKTERSSARPDDVNCTEIACCSRFLELCRLRQIVNSDGADTRRNLMNGLIYLVGLIVVILAVLSFFGLR